MFVSNFKSINGVCDFVLQAHFFFQQLVLGMGYCHNMQVCHRDLKLENMLLDGSQAPRFKICDFGYSKVLIIMSSLFMLLLKHYHIILCLLMFG
ncbi:putative protein kinase CAMK-OST1L family [Helianthus anomalus]